MDKNAIKKYAIWARRELIARVSQRAALYEITAEGFGDADAVSVHGRILTLEEKNQRRALIEKIKEKGYEQVMEEVAYTWFNRFSALRFMEVNGYLPSHVRVFTDDENNFKPQIMTEAINLEMEGLDMQKVYAYKTANDDDGLFKYLIITQCNALSDILPGMFQKISDYTELLFPDNLLREGSVVEQMISMIPEEDWTDQVQIIGWLYQYYNTEPKDQVFANLKKNIKISKENIPAATQLFTPDWIVRYMVENSLGRLWIEGHPNEELKSSWKYYLDEAEQEENIEKQLKEIRKEYAQLKPEDIRCIDPCMGSGHILVYMFDVLVQIYEAYGYSAREAASSIVKNNIWGVDIDERATQLAYFSIMMKARQYDRRFFIRGIQPHIYSMLETNGLRIAYKQIISDFPLTKEYKNTLLYLLDVFTDAKEYGSVLHLETRDYIGLRNTGEHAFDAFNEEYNLTLWQTVIIPKILLLIDLAVVLTQKYHIVVTNPPYMGSGGMSAKLSDFVKNNYPDSKSDLFAVFIERCLEMTRKNGYQAMITQHAWMFLSSFEKLRAKLQNIDMVNMIHLGPRAFEEIGGEVVQTTSFVQSKRHTTAYQGTYCRLIEPTTQQGKEDLFLRCENRYIAQQDNFTKIPGAPVVYWLSKPFITAFRAVKIGELATPKVGLQTGENARFVRFWFEVAFNSISFHEHSVNTAKESGYKWFPYNKGGEYRKWYGNDDFVVNWENDGFEIKHFVDNKGKLRSRPQNTYTYFHECISWSKVSSGSIAFRYKPNGFIYDVAGTSIFADGTLIRYLCGFNNSVVALAILNAISPTLNYEVGHISSLPVIVSSKYKELVINIVEKCIEISRADWNSFENAWDFQRHPLVSSLIGKENIRLSECWQNWVRECDERFALLKSNEEKLNSIFIDIYCLKNELRPNVDNNSISVHKAVLSRDIRSLISFAVGCMFGRYSLDIHGLVYAGGKWDETKYSTFMADVDAIIPICDDEYFNDDIVSRFVEFVEVVYGKDTLEENLQFIADALGGSGTSREVIRNYFINGFYADHLKVYQKSPIYWLFDSGKKNGFKCLVYMHRYQPDTIARIRTDYVHEQQSRYRTAIADLQSRIDNAATTSERVKLSKKLKTVQEQDEELRIYEEKIHHLADQMIKIDLDDGVKVNYAKFQDVLAKIK